MQCNAVWDQTFSPACSSESQLINWLITASTQSKSFRLSSLIICYTNTGVFTSLTSWSWRLNHLYIPALISYIFAARQKRDVLVVFVDPAHKRQWRQQRAALGADQASTLNSGGMNSRLFIPQTQADRESSDRTVRGFERKEGMRKNLSLESKPGGERRSGALNSMSQAPVCRSVTCVHPLMFTCKMTKPGQGVCVCVCAWLKVLQRDRGEETLQYFKLTV